MAIKLYKPTTAARRKTSILVNKDLSKVRPHKALRLIKKKHAGRNNQGRITVRHQGGGVKRYIRLVDFRMNKFDVPARVETIEFDPNRNASIALLVYADGERRYILAPEHLKIGDKIVSSKNKVAITVGNPSVLISKIHPDRSVQIKNSSSQEIDLSGWSLKDNFGKTFVIPDGTYIQGSKTLVLNSKRLKLSAANIILFSPSGSMASYSDSLALKTSTTNSISRSSSQSSSSKISSTPKGEVMGYSDTGDTVNLNERLTGSTSSATKQKQPSVWMIVFVGILVSTSVLVFFLYKKKEEKVVTEEDEFQLID